MQKYEFNNWVEFVKGVFPNFNPAKSELMLDAWKEVIKNHTLDQAKTAVKQYVVEKSSKFEPQPKEIADILKANKPVDKVVEEVGGVIQDYADKRFHDDIVLGVCRHNLYIYRQTYKTYNRINQELLEEVCMQRTGKPAEFPSDEELRASGFDPKAKMPPKDVYRLMDIFRTKGCQL
jgi:hypothetical protein